VRIAAYTLITLLNAEAQVQKPSDGVKTGRITRPKFKLPDDPAVADLLLHAIMMDSEAPMSTAYIEHLSGSKAAGDKLAELVRRRPLLCACLQATGLTTRLPSQTTQYDFGQGIPYRHNEYAILKTPKKSQPPNYHVNLQVPQPTYVLLDLPADDESELDIEVPPLAQLEFPTFTNVDLEVYRCEIALSFAHWNAPVRFFALAVLKRLIATHPTAFMLFARPTLEIVSSELSHNALITRECHGLVLAFLIVCRYRYESVSYQFSEFESDFFETHLPAMLSAIDLEQLDGEPLTQSLRAALLRTTAARELTAALIPTDLTFSELVSQRYRWPSFTNSLLVCDGAYAEVWIGKAALHIDDFAPSEFLDQVIMPLLLSCPADLATSYLAEAASVNADAANEARRKIQATIGELYNASGFPLSKL
jgi:hypothetical protein